MRKVVDHQIQVGITVRKPKGVQITREFLLQCLYYYAEHGGPPPGVTVRVIEWTKAGHTYVYEEPHDIQAALQSALRITSNFHFSGVETGLAAQSAAEAPLMEVEREREEAEREREAARQRELERKRRSEAAKRGWEKRREREAARQRELEKKRRSEAAKRGWEKRRKRKVARKRRRSKRQRR
jgi:hypothetical protein